MKCIIPGNRVKVFARAVNTLARIGDEIHVEFLTDGLVIRAVSLAKSAYGSFTFRHDFFNEFRNDVARRRKSLGQTNVQCQFRFHIKPLLCILKPYNIGESLESFEIEVDRSEHLMHFGFHKKNQVSHRHSFTLLETSFCQTAYAKEDTKSVATASAHLLIEIVHYFPNKTEEITLTFQADKFTVTNYTADQPDPKQALQMQLIMDMNEFENYEIDHATALTVTLKELKGIVSFLASDVADFGIPIKLYFTEPGVPLLFVIDSPGQYEGTFVVATVEAGQENPLTQSAATQVSVPHTNTGNGESAASPEAEPPIPPEVATSSKSSNKVSQHNGNTDAAGSFRKSDMPGTTATKRLLGLDQSGYLTQRPSQVLANRQPYLVPESDEEAETADDSDREEQGKDGF